MASSIFAYIEDLQVRMLAKFEIQTLNKTRFQYDHV